MREPKNNYERTLHKQSCMDSYRQEMEEINDYAPNVEDIYYSEHLGVWIMTFKNGLDDNEFDTKEEALEFLHQEG